MLQIATNNEIIIDYKSTGLTVTQRQEGTVVRKYGQIERITMPKSRYTLCNRVGADEFESDLRKVGAI